MKLLLCCFISTVLAVFYPISLGTTLAADITPETADQVSEIKRYGERVVNDIALSPDGQLVAIATSLSIEFRDTNKLSVATRTVQTDTPIQTIVFDPSGQILAGEGKNKVIYLWRVTDGQLIREFESLGKGEISHLTFSGAGEFLMFLADGTVKALSISDGKIVVTSNVKISGFDSLKISPDAQMLAVPRGSSIMLLRLSGEVLRILKGHTSEVSELAFSPDGQQLAGMGEDGSILIWSVSEGRRLRTLKSLSGDSSRLSFSPDGRLLVVATPKVGAAVWDLGTGKQISNLRESNIQTAKVSLSRDDKLLLTDSTSELRIWQSLGSKLLGRLSLPKTNLPERIAFSYDGEILARSFTPGRAKVEQVSNGRQVADLSSNACCWIFSFVENTFPLSYVPVSISPQQRLIALSANNRRHTEESLINESLILLQDLRRRTRSEFPISDNILSLAFSPDEQLLACGGSKVHLVDTRSRRVIRTLEHGDQRVSSLAFSSDGQLLAAASLNGVIQFWQVADGKLVRELPKQEKAVLSIAFSPDNTLLATTGADKTVRLWQVADGKSVQTLKGHESIVGALTFSADGAILASGALDGAINLWQVSDGKLLKTLKGHTDNVLGVAFTKDGRLASTSSDGTTRLWGTK